MLPLSVSAQPSQALLKLTIGQILLGAFCSADATVEALEWHSLSPSKHSTDYPKYHNDGDYGPNPRPLDHFRHLPVLFLSLATSVFRQGKPEWQIKLFVSYYLLTTKATPTTATTPSPIQSISLLFFSASLSLTPVALRTAS